MGPAKDIAWMSEWKIKKYFEEQAHLFNNISFGIDVCQDAWMNFLECGKTKDIAYFLQKV